MVYKSYPFFTTHDMQIVCYIINTGSDLLELYTEINVQDHNQLSFGLDDWQEFTIVFNDG